MQIVQTGRRDQVDGRCYEVKARFGQAHLLINGAAVRGWTPLRAPPALDGLDLAVSVNLKAVAPRDDILKAAIIGA